MSSWPGRPWHSVMMSANICGGGLGEGTNPSGLAVSREIGSAGISIDCPGLQNDGDESE